MKREDEKLTSNVVGSPGRSKAAENQRRACHRYEFVSKEPGTPDFATFGRRVESGQELIEIWTKGKNKMPSYEKRKGH
jgi:cytochrome c5